MLRAAHLCKPVIADAAGPILVDTPIFQERNVHANTPNDSYPLSAHKIVGNRVIQRRSQSQGREV